MITKYSSLNKKTITLYRGLEEEFNPKYERLKAPAAGYTPTDYSYWTDNIELAKQYGKYVYKIELPLSAMGDSYIDEDGERPLFYKNQINRKFNNILGDEYLVYQGHELFSWDMIKPAFSEKVR